MKSNKDTSSVIRTIRRIDREAKATNYDTAGLIRQETKAQREDQRTAFEYEAL